MRTTLTLEDQAFTIAQTYARARALKLGQAVSELILRGQPQSLPLRRKGETWVADLPAGTPRLTAAQVKALLDDFP